MYFTLTGCNHYFGMAFIEKGMVLEIVKESDNAYDREAIRVQADGLGKIGYVANSPQTVKGESWSAGRIYDKIGDTARARVVYVIPGGVICEVLNDPPPDRSRRQRK